MKHLLLFLLIFLSVRVSSQNTHIDSVLQKIETATDSEKLILYEKLLSNHVTDTTKRYGELIENAIIYSKKIQNKSYELRFNLIKAENYTQKYFYEFALNLYDSCLHVATEHKLPKISADIYFSKAGLHEQKNEQESALKNYFSALTTYEELGDTIMVCNTFNSIGLLYTTMEQNRKAIEYFTQSIILLKDTIKFSSEILSCINNIGYAYDALGEKEQAIQKYLQVYDISVKTNNHGWLVLASFNIGDSYRMFEDYEKAIYYTEMCIDTAARYEATYYVLLGKANLAEIYYDMGKYSDAQTIMEAVLPTIVKEGNPPDAIYHLEVLGNIYLKLKRFDKSAETFKFLVHFKDSIQSLEVMTQIAKMQSIFENERREKNIRILKTENELGKTQLERQTAYRNSFIIGFILTLGIAFTVFKAYKNKRRDNQLLAEKNAEISTQKEEILVQNEVLYQQKEEISTQAQYLESANIEITEQRDELAKSQRLLNSSITYAARIQSAVLPDEDVIAGILPEYFILLRPKNVVSGDFYFVRKIKEYILFAAADCTGHGVPGAFMSMLGITLLNEIVKNEDVTTSADVLNQLRNQIKISLKQTGKQGEQQDGLDIAFCSVNTETLELSFAGAHNPCWIVRRNPITEQNELIEIEADKQPIGIYLKETPFTPKTFQLKKNDVIYLFSDGYADQISVETCKKLFLRGFKQTILDISTMPLKNQCKELETRFIERMGKNKQVDDVLVLGVKF